MILAIDTSAAISVAVLEADQVRAARQEFAPRHHAELLAVQVRDAMAEAGVTGSDIEYVVVGTGPAPFTGLRVGLITARTLGAAWEVPVYGWCSLDAVGAEHGGDVTVVADARRSEVYWATYRAGQREGGPHVSAPAEVTVVDDVRGRGAVLYPEVFPNAVDADPDPAWLARLVESHSERTEQSLPTTPLYLRRPDVHGG